MSGYNPASNSYKKARRKLHPVMDEIDRPTRLSQEDLACPICMGELFRRIPQAEGTTTATTRIKSTKPRDGAGETDMNETSMSPPLTYQDPDNYDGRRPVSAPAPADADANADARMFQWLADDVVSLRTCQHTFHARCLTKWFMMKRYDCPVCRAVYWGAGLDEKSRMGRGTEVAAGIIGTHEQREQREPMTAAEAVAATAGEGDTVAVPPPTYQREGSSAEQSTQWAGVMV